MQVYRITQAKFENDLSGNGARLYGGRWNSEGLFALYTSESRSLALLENLVHVPVHLLRFQQYFLMTIEIPDAATMQHIQPVELPKGWNAFVPTPITRRLGDLFLKEQQHLILSVPSVVMPEERNYIINPLHPGMEEVRITARRLISLDDRILQVVQ